MRIVRDRREAAPARARELIQRALASADDFTSTYANTPVAKRRTGNFLQRQQTL
jgi:hypothetical protein